MMYKKPIQLAVCLLLFTLLSVSVIWARGRKETYPDPGDMSMLRIQDPVPVDPEVTKGKLENGLTYYIRHNDKPENRLVLRLAVNAGSILETEEQRGIAHFVEHMAFAGTENFEKDEIVDYLEGIGIRFGPDINAYTSFDETVYKLTIPTDDRKVVEKGFQILSEWAFRVSFEPEAIDKERGVIIEEWRLGRGAQARMREEYFPVLFQGSRYAERLPIGKKEVIENCEYRTLTGFYRDWYRPDLMAVSAVGDYPEEEIEKILKKYFNGEAPGEERKERPFYPVPDHEETLYSTVTDPEATNTVVRVMKKYNPAKQLRVSDYRDMIIRSMYDRMLNQRLKELTQLPDPPFIYAVSDSAELVRTKSVYELAAVVPEGGTERGLEALMAEAKRVRLHGFTAGELARVKEELQSYYQRAYDERDKMESFRLADEYVRNYLHGEFIPGIEYEYELFRRYAPEIGLEEVNRLGAALLAGDNRVLLVTGPEQQREVLPAAGGLEAVVEQAERKDVGPYIDSVAGTELFTFSPVPGSIIREIYHPEYGITELILGNGVKVLLRPSKLKNREIILSAYSPGGVSTIPDEEYISAMMLPSIIGVSGVGDFSAVELRKLLAGKQVSLNPTVGSYLEGFSGSSTPEDLEILFQLVHLYMTSPRQDTDAFQSLKSRLQALIANRLLQPEAVFSDKMQELISRDHFRRRPLTSAILEEMDPDTAFRVYEKLFGDAGDFTFFIAGNFQMQRIKPLLTAYLGSLPSAGGGGHWQDEGVRFPDSVIEEEIYAGIEAKSRVSLVFGGPLDWSYPRQHMFDSLIQALDIRLREVIREDVSGTYGVGVSGGFAPYPQADYLLQIYFGCDPERAEELTALLFRELENVKEVPFEEKILDKVREQQRRSFEEAREENRFWTAVMREAELYNLPCETILDIEALIEQVTAENMLNFAGEVLRFDRYVLGTLYPRGESDGGGEK